MMMMTTDETSTSFQRAIYWIFAAAGVFVLAHAFVPFDEFAQRTDDAFYYLRATYNYPDTGFWTFDTIHTTNGVQPLWAWLLTAVAQVMAWFGVRDPDLFARTVVAITGLFHVGSCLLLFRLLARQVSIAAGVAAAAAYLLPIGIMWRHVWGMENSLNAFCLLSALSYYLFSFRGNESSRRAVVLGVLFGLAALARLNAVLLAICAVATLLLAGRQTLAERLRHAVIVAAVSASCVVPYLAWNYATTGHPLPISGAVKAVLTDRFMADNNLESRLSLEFVDVIVHRYWDVLRAFVTNRLADATTVVGGRIVFGDDQRRGFHYLTILIAVAPVVFGLRRWLAELGGAFARLRPLSFVLAYALLNFAVSVYSYPHQISNAMPKWWLVESELVIVTVAGTLIGTAVAYLGTIALPPLVRRPAVIAGLILLVALHGQRMVRFYFDEDIQVREWNASWGFESLRAARWIEANLPEDAIVGSWNAGLVGHYSNRRVTNLDGLINNFELIPYLRDRNLGAYILEQNIAYLSDMAPIYTLYDIHDQLTLQEIYRNPNAMMRTDYIIYRVVGPAGAAGSAASD